MSLKYFANNCGSKISPTLEVQTARCCRSLVLEVYLKICRIEGVQKQRCYESLVFLVQVKSLSSYLSKSSSNSANDKVVQIF